ncbi:MULTISPECIES: glycosyltransferase family 2 protein [Acinetobacter calcoaceticus/baumannii complex]|uniref:Gtr188 n=1 Tax=Acinetobacter baumannii TaxID=470 RepID=A0A481WWG5_ACIBA|nr:glycosyltransferase family 2 protein [Acinetobacter sp. 907131]EXE25490.1 rhamnosyltransferase family protein [Acinetobacter sp. 907131]QBK17818.1 Gtr188 [Acinetobacter baumannii]HAV5308880.1 glycosyltransferase family 2 protein [Acinetobacter baumannii]
MNIACIIVSFNPDISRLLMLVNDITNQGAKPILIDNDSRDFEIFSKDIPENIYVLKLPSNMGIAHAQNVGIEYAKKIKSEYVFLFDQDSRIPADFIKNMVSEYQELELEDKELGILGPRLYNDYYDFYYKANVKGDWGGNIKVDVRNILHPLKVNFLIASGSLMRIVLFDKVGLLKDNYFIDSVDTEFCFRTISCNYAVYMSGRNFMFHNVGDKTLKIFKWDISIHSALRRYFMLRNYIFMLNESYVSKRVVFGFLIRYLIVQSLIFIKVDNRKEYFKYFFKAIVDGLIGKGGKP